uniref:Uncharacterized protein n=1 Tax=uncultured prokaryote TaxID=198431 RepID=A0A0H5Q3Y0_9ZZZZ|nr:hypothetical protein [uncultured prokaryote]
MAGEKHLYVVAQGTYTDSSLVTEQWQVGLRFYAAPGGAPDPVGTLSSAWDVVADSVSRTESLWRIDGNWRVEGGINDLNVDDWLNDQLAPAFTTWMAQAAISNVCRLDTLKVYPVGAPTGVVIPAPPYASGSPMTLTWTSSSPVGGGGATLMPLQVSIVQSHRTAQIGRRGRGRMYLPPSPIGAMSTAGSAASQVASSYISGSKAAQVALLEACQISTASEGFGCYPAIIGSPWSAYGLISQVQVGNYADSQRRRRGNLTETYSSTATSWH